MRLFGCLLYGLDVNIVESLSEWVDRVSDFLHAWCVMRCVPVLTHSPQQTVLPNDLVGIDSAAPSADTRAQRVTHPVGSRLVCSLAVVFECG